MKTELLKLTLSNIDVIPEKHSDQLTQFDCVQSFSLCHLDELSFDEVQRLAEQSLICVTKTRRGQYKLLANNNIFSLLRVYKDANELIFSALVYHHLNEDEKIDALKCQLIQLPALHISAYQNIAKTIGQRIKLFNDLFNIKINTAQVTRLANYSRTAFRIKREK